MKVLYVITLLCYNKYYAYLSLFRRYRVSRKLQLHRIYILRLALIYFLVVINWISADINKLNSYFNLCFFYNAIAFRN